MKFYQEITLLPNHEIGVNFLWSKIFQQIHIGLVEIKDLQEKVPIGISFPEGVFEKKIGNLGGKLRLFAPDEATLQKFNAAKWLANFTDYVHLTGVREINLNKITGYAIYHRHQPKVNKERLARRYSKRHNIDYETALKQYSDMEEKRIELPFIRLKSLSGGENFCLWIKKVNTQDPAEKKFNTYGLSLSPKSSKFFSAVPEF